MTAPVVDRRFFLRHCSAAAAGVALGRGLPAPRQHAPGRLSELNVDALPHFVDPLVIPPRAMPVGVRATPHANTPVYRLPLQAVTARVHRDMPPTRFWSFGTTFPGPTIEMTRGQGAWIDWVNALPARHFLPIDHTLHGAGADLPDSRAVVHVHGARVRPEHDGHPEQWIRSGATASYYYPNDQDAATLWYHDHTMGINRLNVYAGLFGAFLVRDPAEASLDLPTGTRDLPLLFCDRDFDTAGQLLYPVSDDPERPWVSEVVGDAILVNGRLAPYAEVDPAPYRLRLINACNGRFLSLSVEGEPPLYQIASDQGLLDRPVALPRVDLLSAERADVVVDFSRYAGRRLILKSGAQPILEWRVGGVSPRAFQVPAVLRPIARLTAAQALATRTHTLAEDDDMYKNAMRMVLNGRRWHDPVTEIAELGSVEVWNLINLTDDAHPIHVHLVRFQILDRRAFRVGAYRRTRTLEYIAPAEPPAPGETGWKDTVRVDPGMVTRIVIHFDGYAGRYMWHCHLLEHGDNEMMRPLEIVPAPAARHGSDRS